MRRTLVMPWLLATAFAQHPPVPAQPAVQEPLQLAQQLRLDARWRTREVGDGVVLRQRLFASLFGAPQCLTVLTIAANAPARFDVAAPSRREPTSAIAAANGALAAINGGYFDIRGSGKSLGLLRLDGALSVPAEPRQASVGVAAGGALLLAVRPAGDWPEVHEALGAGPMLLAGGEVLPPPERLRRARHPRTAIGVARDGTVTWLTIDGRTEPAAGATLEETAQVLAALGCTDALNLDGGGSTTLWVAGLGVQNHPCDDRRFDAAGERAVANALLLHAPAVVVADDGDAQLAGDGWRQRAGGDDVHRDGFACSDAAGARATFRVVLPSGGRWRVAGRWPAAAATGAAPWRVVAGAIAVDAPPFVSGAWQHVAELEAAAGEPVVVVVSGTGGTLVVDALRFVQVAPGGGAGGTPAAAPRAK